jgi:hypothetical protein
VDERYLQAGVHRDACRFGHIAWISRRQRSVLWDPQHVWN